MGGSWGGEPTAEAPGSRVHVGAAVRTCTSAATGGGDLGPGTCRAEQRRPRAEGSVADGAVMSGVSTAALRAPGGCNLSDRRRDTASPAGTVALTSPCE